MLEEIAEVVGGRGPPDIGRIGRSCASVAERHPPPSTRLVSSINGTVYSWAVVSEFDTRKR
jgi:hypothetical protein